MMKRSTYIDLRMLKHFIHTSCTIYAINNADASVYRYGKPSDSRQFPAPPHRIKGTLHIYHYRAHDTGKGYSMNLYLYRFQPKCHADTYFYARTGDFIMLTVGTLSMLKKKKVCDKRYFIWGADEPLACAVLLIWIITTKGYGRPLEFLFLISFVLLLYLLLLITPDC